MTEEVTKYVVEVELNSDKATKKLDLFNKKMMAYNKTYEKFKTKQSVVRKPERSVRKTSTIAASHIQPEKVQTKLQKAPINRLSELIKKESTLPNLYKKPLPVTSDEDLKLKNKTSIRDKANGELNKEQLKVLKLKKDLDKQLNKEHLKALKMNEAFDKKLNKGKEKLQAAKRKQVLDSLTEKTKAPRAKESLFVERDKKRKASSKRRQRIDERESRSLSAAKTRFSMSSMALRAPTGEAERATKQALLESVAKAKTANQVRMIVAKERERLHLNKMTERSLNKQNFLMRRLESSSKQMAGNMLSAFALAGIGAGVTRVGQDFEAVHNTMLAVSEDSVAAAANFKFVRDEAYRLGLGLTQSAKGFAKMVAARGSMKKEEVETLFTGVSELGTVLGLTAEESNRAVNAITQMMSKGKISAEELRLQLGEVIPTAIQDMAKAAQNAGKIDKSLGLNEAVAAMLKLQEQGKLISSEILPEFGKVLSKSASKGLEGALNSNRVAMNRLMFSIQEASDVIFRSGFAKGLTELFNTLAESIVDLSPLWESIGKIVGSVFSLIAKGVALVTPTLLSLSSILKSISNGLGESWAFLVAIAGPALYLGKILGGYNLKMLPFVGQFVTLLGLIQEVAFWAEELDNLLFSRDKAGLLFDARTGKTDTNKLIDLFTPFSSPEKIKQQQQAVSESGKTEQFSKLPSWFTTFISNQKAIGGIPTMNSLPPIAVHLSLNADAEKMGMIMANDPSVKDSIHTEIKQIQN
jgi:tape measure domain-containing protein